ncbi:hypothetical protein BEWA_011980 [Theileria equi strain WA]|uniref:AP2/ERF domain-containing protein n=1 Tax=Theileria equi strain WA TaxID=1537102 RepID=L1LBI8_THEEQ|nr:hypothetical protein BEWA_011980 [Theileria equi strain WA]EKX72639.1 hypothetical protein BEWA_011980 [Theileria equi strain WA]|eukprot:XP_004832091.1 hypothetical protein BEWA_011980 [Theileria equi strain WA]
MLETQWHNAHLYSNNHLNSENVEFGTLKEQPFKEVPYLSECTTLPAGSANSPCTTICEGVDEVNGQGTSDVNANKPPEANREIQGFGMDHAPELLDYSKSIYNNVEELQRYPGIVGYLSTGLNQYNGETNNGFPSGISDIPSNFTNNIQGYSPALVENINLQKFPFGNLYNSCEREGSISGVKFQPSDNRWIARWTTAAGKRACKSFSVNIYGFEQARSLAIDARQKGVALSGRSFCNRERQHAMRSGVGIIGIRFDKTQARWVSSYYEGGKRKFRYFTVKDYGYEQAKQHAILWKACNDERLVRYRRNGAEKYPGWGWYSQGDASMNFSQQYYLPVDQNPNMQIQSTNDGYSQSSENYTNYLSIGDSVYGYGSSVDSRVANGSVCGSSASMESNDEDETCHISGVTFDRTNRRWGARWTTTDGRRNVRYFPVRQHGFSEAKRLAIICRLQAADCEESQI